MEEGRWTSDESSAEGQVFEDRLWALLTEQSRGHLHVFRPLVDRGIDGLLHRLSDGAYIAVQAKGRSSLTDGEVRLNVKARSVTDDTVVIVGGEIVEGGLGPTLLVVGTPDFRRLALLTTSAGVAMYWMSFGMRPIQRSRWLPWLVPSDRLVERFGVSQGLPALAITAVPLPLVKSELGFLGEVEVIRRLAEAEKLSLYRPFPDLEMVELAVRHTKTGQVVGLQIKTVSVDDTRVIPSVGIAMSTFRSSPTTYLVVVAWMPSEGRFHEECLVIPSEEVLQFAKPTKLHHYSFKYHPGSTKQIRLNRYRRRLSGLRSEIEKLL